MHHQSEDCESEYHRQHEHDYAPDNKTRLVFAKRASSPSTLWLLGVLLWLRLDLYVRRCAGGFCCRRCRGRNLTDLFWRPHRDSSESLLEEIASADEINHQGS